MKSASDEFAPPEPHEVEVSVFGRGCGESTLIHIGGGKWVLIDCLLSEAGNPAPLVYLSSIGVAADSALKFIVATHWHDDHVGGLAEVYAQCPNAHLSYPIAMMDDEWIAYRRSVADCGTDTLGSGVRELEKIAALQRSLGRQVPRYAKADVIMFSSDGADLGHGMPTEVKFLSPSDRDVHDFMTKLAQTPKPEKPKRVRSPPRNDVSIATWLTFGTHRVLMGGDLEVTATQDTGWDAVLNSPAQLVGRAALYKNSHHGSKTGHHSAIWTNHLATDDPIVVIAPFSRSRLPREQDVARISLATKRSYITGQAQRRARSRDVAIDRTLREMNARVSAIPDVGQVRLRIDPRDAAASWRVELLRGAVPLDQFRPAA